MQFFQIISRQVIKSIEKGKGLSEIDQVRIIYWSNVFMYKNNNNNLFIISLSGNNIYQMLLIYMFFVEDTICDWVYYRCCYVSVILIRLWSTKVFLRPSKVFLKIWIVFEVVLYRMLQNGQAGQVQMDQTTL